MFITANQVQPIIFTILNILPLLLVNIALLTNTNNVTLLNIMFTEHGSLFNVQRLLGPTFGVLSALTLRLPDLDNFQVKTIHVNQVLPFYIIMIIIAIITMTAPSKYELTSHQCNLILVLQKASEELSPPAKYLHVPGNVDTVLYHLAPAAAAIR